MLWTPASDFNWSVDNFGATYTDAGFAAAVTAAGTAHTKGTAVELIADTSVTEDVYGISLVFARTNTIAQIRSFLFDLLIDPAGGTSYSVAIANILVDRPSLVMGGYHYYFPLYLKSGTTIGGQVQCSTASGALRAGVRLHGKPSRPELVKVGTKVETIGADTAATDGSVGVTPGTNAMGSYSTTLGTTSIDAWWWQLGVTQADTTISLNSALFDVAVNATNKIIVAENIPLMGTTSEQIGMGSMGSKPPIKFVSAGQDVYVRGASLGAPNSTVTAVVYAVGG